MRKKIILSLISLSIPISFSISLPFSPLESIKNTTIVATTLVSSTAGFVGLRYLFNFKFNKRDELIKRSFSFLSNIPIFYDLKLYRSHYLNIKKINWKFVGNKIINYFDYADMAVGFMPVFGDIFDAVDLSMHIIYDYKFEKGNLKWDLLFIGLALIPGVSAGMERVSFKLFTRKLVKIGLDSRKAKEVAKIGKEFKWGKKTRIEIANFFKLEKARRLAEKDVRMATETAYGYSFLLKEGKNIEADRVIKYVSKREEELRKFEGKGLHRIVFQYGFLGKQFSIKKVEKLYKMFGKDLKGVLLFDLREVDQIIENKEIRKVIKDLNNVAFERFTYIYIEEEALEDSERVVKIIKSMVFTSKWIEKAERHFGVEAEYSHINMINAETGWAGMYESKRHFVTFNFYYDENERYLVEHELMHGIGTKIVSPSKLNKMGNEFYSKYMELYQNPKIAYSLSKLSVNEYMDLLNVKIWEEIGYKKYFYEHLESMKRFKQVELTDNKIIIRRFEEEKLIFANEYKSLVKDVKIKFAKNMDPEVKEYLRDISKRLSYYYNNIKVR